MVVLLATGAVPAAVAALLAAGALVLLNVITVNHAFRAVSWTTVVLVGGMIPLSLAMQQTGAAELLATELTDAVGDSSTWVLLAGLFLLTAVLGQLISNTATALIVIPIAVSAAAGAGRVPAPGAHGRQRGGHRRAPHPGGHPGQPHGDGAGGYRFGDYWKLGLPLMGWYFVVSVLIVPLIW